MLGLGSPRASAASVRRARRRRFWKTATRETRASVASTSSAVLCADANPRLGDPEFRVAPDDPVDPADPWRCVDAPLPAHAYAYESPASPPNPNRASAAPRETAVGATAPISAKPGSRRARAAAVPTDSNAVTRNEASEASRVGERAEASRYPFPCP